VHNPIQHNACREGREDTHTQVHTRSPTPIKYNIKTLFTQKLHCVQLESDGRGKGRNEWNIDALEVFLGGLFFASLLPFSIALLLVLHTSRRARPSSQHEIRLSPVTSPSSKSFAESKLRAYSNKMLAVALVVLGLQMNSVFIPFFLFFVRFLKKYLFCLILRACFRLLL